MHSEEREDKPIVDKAVVDKPVVDKPVVEKKPAEPSKTKRALTIGGVIVAGLGAAYGGGLLHGHAGASAAEERAEKLETEVQAGKRDLDALNAKVTRLEARRHLHLALLSMEQRNFGIAQEHVTHAGALLQATSPEGELGQLADEVRAFRLTASEDQSKERGSVIGFAEKLDKLMPPAKP